MSTDDPHGQEPSRTSRFRLNVRTLAVAAGALVALAAVGTYAVVSDDSGTSAPGASSGSSSEASGAATGAATSQTEAAYEYAECVRNEGIDGFPDPTVEADGGVVFEGMSDIGASEDDLAQAREACADILDEFAPSGGQRRHGTGMPPDQLAAQGWEKITPGGDCACADGSEFSFFARDKSAEKVVLFLDGGGACWSAATCDPAGSNEYQSTTKPPSAEGVFDAGNGRNPLAGYSFVFVPYCGGDIHLGNATTEYTSDLTVHHKGYVNGNAALAYLVTTFPDATDVVVIGASAGSLTAPLYAGLVADRLPDAHVTSISDSSGGYPDAPAFNDILTGSAWGASTALADVPADLRTAPGLFIAMAQQHPDIVFARHDHAYDEEQSSKITLASGSDADLLPLIDANEAQIESAGVNLLSFTAPGDQHVVLGDDAFYSESVGGVDLVDWFDDVVAGRSVDDVRCTVCTSG